MERMWIGLVGSFMRHGKVICPSPSRGKMETPQAEQAVCIKGYDVLPRLIKGVDKEHIFAL